MFDVAMKMTAGDALLKGQKPLGCLWLWFIKKLERFLSNEISKELPNSDCFTQQKSLVFDFKIRKVKDTTRKFAWVWKGNLMKTV